MKDELILTETEYVKKLLTKTRALHNAIEDLGNFFDTFYCNKDGVLFEPNDYITNCYPFKIDFQELPLLVGDWRYSIEATYKKIKYNEKNLNKNLSLSDDEEMKIKM